MWFTKHNNYDNGMISASTRLISIILISICSYWDHFFRYDKKVYIALDGTALQRRERERKYKSNNNNKKWIIIIITQN